MPVTANYLGQDDVFCSRPLYVIPDSYFAVGAPANVSTLPVYVTVDAGAYTTTNGDTYTFAISYYIV